MAGRKILVTAGPTYESIDPVRFIGNHSSGKMGIAIADEAAARGAKVVLVLGPTHLQATHQEIKTVRVQNAAQMYEAVHRYFKDTDVAVLAAAVADFTPEKTAPHKIKKHQATLSIPLKQTKDILASLGEIKTPSQILIGFAMETQNAKANALKKLKRKNLDFIVLNSINEKGAGFKHDTNKVSILTKNGDVYDYPLKSKKAVAADILDMAEKMFYSAGN